MFFVKFQESSKNKTEKLKVNIKSIQRHQMSVRNSISSHFFSNLAKIAFRARLMAHKKTKNVGRKKIWPRKFSAEEYFGRKYFWSKKFSAAKFFGRKEFRPKNIWAENFFGRKIFRPKTFSAEKYFGRNFFRPEKFSAAKFFGRKCLRPKISTEKFSADTFRQKLFRPKT